MSRYSTKILQYIADNKHADPLKLMLKKSHFEEVSMKEIASQIIGQKVAKSKYPTLLNYPQYWYPTKTSLEQASSELTARYKSQLVDGSSLVDLTGGMGIDTYFFSQQIDSVTYIEPDDQLCERAKYNFSILGSKIDVVNTTAEDFLKTEKQASWIYLDPSRRVDGNRKNSIQQLVPNVVELQDHLFERSDNILLKLSPMQDLQEVLSTLQHVKDIHCVAVENEMKEVLVIMQKGYENEVNLHLAILSESGNQTFTNSYTDRDQICYSAEAGSYLYQPHVTFLKAGLHDFDASSRGLSKLHPNTQFYTHDKVLSDYPGRIFEVKETGTLQKKWLKKYLPKGQANIISKNFPLTPSEISKKVGLKDGGEDYVLACTTHDGSKKIFICNRLK